MVSGIDKLAVMKFDVLDSIEKVKVCTSYRIDGKLTDQFPASISVLSRASPVYQEYQGWDKTAHAKRYGEVPESALDYISALEEILKTEIVIISTGPGEEDTIFKNDRIFTY
jgi:adenylosuccinate synthase